MKVSEITVENVKEYTHIDYDDNLLPLFLKAAIKHVKEYTGLNIEQMDRNEDLTVAVLIIAAEMYDTRSASVTTNSKLNMLLDNILGMYSINLL